MFLSKSNEGLSSTLAVAMFTNNTKQQYAIVEFNQTSDMTNQVELQQTRWSFKNINQSSQYLWLEMFKRSSRDITDLEELHKERHQPRFRLAWN